MLRVSESRVFGGLGLKGLKVYWTLGLRCLGVVESRA